MIRWLRIASCLFAATAITVLALPGCHKHEDGKTNHEHGKGKSDHDHPETGPHGGPLAEWGKEEYHAELVIDRAGKQATVYILDGTAKKAPKISHEKITDVKIAVVGKLDTFVKLEHDAKKSDDKGIAYVGTHEMFAKPGERKFNINWKVEGEAGGGDVTYAPKLAIALTPKGKYTEDDIKKNGSITPMEKYAKLKHIGGEPAVGDTICPDSKEKANPECVWVIQGQTYAFCCPSCINSFLKVAQNEPEKVKDAKEYVFKK
jgi:YHS domain-containing protein